MPFRPENNLKPDQETDLDQETDGDQKTEEKTIVQRGPFTGFVMRRKSEIGEPDGSDPQVSRVGTRTPGHFRGYSPYPNQKP